MGSHEKMNDFAEHNPARLAEGAMALVEEAHDKMLDEIISEVGCLLANKYAQEQVAQVLDVVAAEFQEARITAFLPTLVFRKASTLLAKSHAAPAPAEPAHGRTEAPAAGARAGEPATKLDFLRFEFKYILPQEVRARIEDQIVHFMALDPFVAGQEQQRYVVRSLYYDDPALSSYYQKIEGALMRAKFRLRTYTDEPTANCATYLELKGRYNSLVFKRRAYFDSAAAFHQCGSVTDKIISRVNGSPIGTQFLAELAHKQIKPLMLIEYLRRPYVARDNSDFRLTLDEDLFGTATDQLFPADTHGRRPILPGHSVMEIKFKNSIPLWFHRIIKNHGLKRISISKVCKGIEVCNLAPPLD
jgi:ribosomal protein L12E/L44/L45/RPP1/RPP2